MRRLEHSVEGRQAAEISVLIPLPIPRITEDLETFVLLDLAAQILRQSDDTQLHGVPNPADGDVARVELTHGRGNFLEAHAVGGEMQRGANGGGGRGGQ